MVSQYRGETSKILFTRHSWNVAKAKQRVGSSFMKEHTITCERTLHKGANCFKNFHMEVTSCDKDPLRRILREAIAIKDACEGEKMTIRMFKDDVEGEVQAKVMLLNSKREIHLPTLATGSVSSISSQL